jgi:hypothetical protein
MEEAGEEGREGDVATKPDPKGMRNSTSCLAGEIREFSVEVTFKVKQAAH